MAVEAVPQSPGGTGPRNTTRRPTRTKTTRRPETTRGPVDITSDAPVQFPVPTNEPAGIQSSVCAGGVCIPGFGITSTTSAPPSTVTSPSVATTPKATMPTSQNGPSPSGVQSPQSQESNGALSAAGSNSSSSNGGLSGGEIAAATVVPIIVLILAAMLAFLWSRRRRQRRTVAEDEVIQTMRMAENTKTSGLPDVETPDPPQGFESYHPTMPSASYAEVTVHSYEPSIPRIKRKEVGAPISVAVPQLSASILQPVSPIDDSRPDPFGDPTPSDSAYLPSTPYSAAVDDAPRYFAHSDVDLDRPHGLSMDNSAVVSSALISDTRPTTARGDDEISLLEEDEVEYGEAAPAQRQRASVIDMLTPSSPTTNGSSSGKDRSSSES